MITRRAFIRTIGKGSAAVALVGVVGCSSEEPASNTLAGSTTGAPSATAANTTNTTTTTKGSTTTSTSGGEWARVNLGFVSAYVLVRDGEAALVDTGTSGSAAQVESTLAGLGLGWSDLGTRCIRLMRA